MEISGFRLPESAKRRLADSLCSSLRSSLLAAGDLAAIQSVDLEPIGVVIGCRAERIDWGEFGLGELGCGYVPGHLTRNPFRVYETHAARGDYLPATEVITKTTSTPTGGIRQTTFVGLQSGLADGETLTTMAAEAPSRVTPVVYPHAAVVPARSAVERMLAEAVELDAAGVVGVEIRHEKRKNGTWECTAMGTAVRMPGGKPLPHPFATSLSGADASKLLRAGYVPVGVALGMSVGIVHDLARARIGRNRFSSFREIDFLTELVAAARAHARSQIGKTVTDVGAEGAILTSQMDLSLDEHSVNAGHHDIIAEVSVVASTIVSFRPSHEVFAGHRPLTVFPLKP